MLLLSVMGMGKSLIPNCVAFGLNSEKKYEIIGGENKSSSRKKKQERGQERHGRGRQ